MWREIVGSRCDDWWLRLLRRVSEGEWVYGRRLYVVLKLSTCGLRVKVFIWFLITSPGKWRWKEDRWGGGEGESDRYEPPLSMNNTARPIIYPQNVKVYCRANRAFLSGWSCLLGWQISLWLSWGRWMTYCVPSLTCLWLYISMTYSSLVRVRKSTYNTFGRSFIPYANTNYVPTSRNAQLA